MHDVCVRSGTYLAVIATFLIQKVCAPSWGWVWRSAGFGGIMPRPGVLEWFGCQAGWRMFTTERHTVIYHLTPFGIMSPAPNFPTSPDLSHHETRHFSQQVFQYGPRSVIWKTWRLYIRRRISSQLHSTEKTNKWETVESIATLPRPLQNNSRKSKNICPVWMSQHFDDSWVLAGFSFPPQVVFIVVRFSANCTDADLLVVFRICSLIVWYLCYTWAPFCP